MLRRQLAGLIVATTIALTVVCSFSLGVAGPQDKTKSQPPAGDNAKEQQKAVPLPTDKEVEKREAQIGKMLAEYDLKPQPLSAIPDDPPPHEGAMNSLPHLVEPPDLILVEVLDALPGRPISGERLVRPDGKIDVRTLVSPIRSRIVRVSTQDQGAPAPAPNPIKIPAGAQGKVTITIEFDGQNLPKVENPEIVPMPQEVPNAGAGEGFKWKVVPPAESGAVFVDITAYNSKNYFVLGDILIAGKMPWTGNETVLDILQYAGGLMPTAEPKDIRLVRPGRGGKPAKVYKVDLAAIQEKGDVTSNYQIFPNDRLIVGRNEVVQKTVAMDRLAAPLQTATSSIHNMANMLRAVQLVDQANSGEILKELVDFWAKEVASKGDLKFDEQTLRDALLQKLKSTSAPKQ
jgi:polysaccharide biosynthesis/export protein